MPKPTSAVRGRESDLVLLLAAYDWSSHLVRTLLALAPFAGHAAQSGDVEGHPSSVHLRLCPKSKEPQAHNMSPLLARHPISLLLPEVVLRAVLSCTCFDELCNLYLGQFSFEAYLRERLGHIVVCVVEAGWCEHDS